MVECLNELGIDATLNEDGYQVPAAVDANAQRDAVGSCEERLGEYTWPAPLTDEELEHLYTLKLEQADCMRRAGADIPDAPTLEVFVASRKPPANTQLSPESTDHLMGLLEEQHFDSALSTALGGKVVFGHKLGTLDHVSHDACVIDADGDRYVLVAVTAGLKWGAEGRAEPLLAGVGEAALRYVDAQLR